MLCIFLQGIHEPTNHQSSKAAISGGLSAFNKIMKILQKSKYKKLKDATNLTPLCEGSSILKINDSTFAFINEDEQRPFLILESEIFGLLMQRLEDRIVHYKAFRQKCLCCGGDGDLTIRLTEVDGFTYQIDENDNIEICRDIEELYHERN